MDVKFDVYFKKNLGTIMKNNEVDLDGIEANVNIDLSQVSSLKVNYKLQDGTKLTDDITIKDIDTRLILVPFKSQVLQVGKNELELEAIMKNGDVKVSQTCTYDIEQGIGEGIIIEGGTNHTHINLTILNSITQSKIDEWDNKSDKDHVHNEYADEVHEHSEYLKEHQDISHKADINDVYTQIQTDNKISEAISKIELKEGPPGPKGDKGDTGPQGPKGEDGLTTSITVNGETYTHVDGTITLPDYPVSVEGSNNASDIAIKDANNNFKSENVEDALTEIGSQIKDIANSGNISSIEPAANDMPKVFFYGNALPTTKDNVNLTMDYVSNTDKFTSYVKLKCQGTSSMSYAKKNFTVTMYSDEARGTALKKDFKGWGSQSKFCLKANYVDTTHTRNLAGARIAYDMVKSRPDSTFKQQLLQCPRNGAVDGFPIKLYFNGEFYGIYTWNIPKDGWMFNMDESNPNHMVLCAEQNNNGSSTSDNNTLICEFRKEWDGGGNSWSIEFGTLSDALKNSFNRCINFVMTATDEEFKANIGDYFDLYSLLDYYCFSYLVAHIDGLGKNMLMVTYDGVIWGATLYDMDSIYGADWNGSSFKDANIQCPEQYQETNSLLWQRIESCFSTELYVRYLELRQGALSLSNIVKHVEEIYDVIPDRVFADEKAKWTSLPGVSANTMTRFRNYMRDRAVYVDAQMLEIGTKVACTGITLSANTLSFTTTDTQTLTATVEPTNTTDVVTWSVSPTGVVTVDGGVVTPIANGNCTITATCGTQSATCNVTVALPGVACTSISLDKTELALGVFEGEAVDDTGVNYLDGATWQDGQLKDNGTIGNGTDKCAEISIEIPGKYILSASVNYQYPKMYVITGNSTVYGAQLAADANTINIFEPCTLKVSVYPNNLEWDASKVSLTRVSFDNLNKDITYQLTESDINIRYTGSDSVYAELYVDAKYDMATLTFNNQVYKCTCKKGFNASENTLSTISALQANSYLYNGDYNGKSYVNIAIPTSLGNTASEILSNLDSSIITINSSQSITDITSSQSGTTILSSQLNATVTPDNCTDTIVWSTNADTVATVDNGLVTAKANGSAVITATCGTQSATCNVTVSGMVNA